MTLVRTPFYVESINLWVERLLKAQFLAPNVFKERAAFYLKPPFLIKIKRHVIRKLIKAYSRRSEKGGILLSKPLIENKRKVLEIYRVIFIDNDSPIPEYSYTFNNKQKKEALKFSFNRENRKLISYPIKFHTHPIFSSMSREATIDQMIQHSLIESFPSQQDQETINEIYTYGKYSFAIPDALIVGDWKSDSLLIGFYGGGIAPRTFSTYIEKMAGEVLSDILYRMAKGFMRQDPFIQLLIVLLMSYVGVITFKYFRYALLILLMFASELFLPSDVAKHKIPNYCCRFQRDSDGYIRIPPLQEEF